MRTSLFPRVSTGIRVSMGFYPRRRLGMFTHRRSLLTRALCPRWRTSFERTLLGLQSFGR
jgi:hypothetical protein